MPVHRTSALPRPPVVASAPPPTRRGTLVVLGGVFLLLVLLLQLKPINDVDIFWQVKLGQLMLATGGLIEHDVFSHIHAGDPTPTLGWLAQIIYAGLHDLGGWRAIQILHVTLFATAFVIAGLMASRQPNRGRYPVLSTLVIGLYLGLMAGLSNADVRPQSFAFLGFAVVLYLARLGPFTPRRLVGIGLTAILWQNTHPSLSLGVLAVGAMAAGEWLTKWRQPDHPAPLFITAATVILALAQLATPMGWQIFEVSGVNLRIARDLVGISEWQPAWDPAVRPAMSGFFLTGGIGLALLIARRRDLRPGDWLLVLVMTGLALQAARFAVFWAIALIPLWTQCLEAVRPVHRFAWLDVPWSSRALWLTGLGGLTTAYALPTLIQGQPLFRDPLTPCLRTLATVVPSGRLYNYREWGGPLILAGYPRWQVTIDGRLYLYDDQDWRNYADVALGRMTLDDIMTKYQPDAFILHPTYHAILIKMLVDSGQHRQLYSDQRCVIFTNH